MLHQLIGPGRSPGLHRLFMDRAVPTPHPLGPPGLAHTLQIPLWSRGKTLHMGFSSVSSKGRGDL